MPITVTMQDCSSLEGVKMDTCTQ